LYAEATSLGEEDEIMKSLRLLMFAALMSLPGLALARSQAPKPDVPESEAGKSFDTLKSLAGEWEGRVTLVPDMPQMSEGHSLYHVSLRVTSRGHAIVHEIQEAGTLLDPAKYDHPVTMLYLDDQRLTLVHYCDAGNRPRMVGKPSPDGRTVEFELVDISGGTQNGHMDHAVFTAVDADHHTEDWTYILPGDKPVRAHFDLHRVSSGARASW
jgi:hypothetical protein